MGQLRKQIWHRHDLRAVVQLATWHMHVATFCRPAGHELAFNVAMAGWVVRLALYTLLPLFPSPWCVLPVELLQGLTFAMGE